MRERHHIAIAGNGRLAKAIQPLLGEKLSVVHLDSEVTEGLLALHPALVVVSTDEPESWNAGSLRAQCRHAGIPILCVSGRSSYAFVGPLEVHGGGGCLDCLDYRWTHAARRVKLLQMSKNPSGTWSGIRIPLSLSEHGVEAVARTVLEEVQDYFNGHVPKTRDRVCVIDRSGSMAWRNVLPSGQCAHCHQDKPDTAEDAFIHLQSHTICSSADLRTRHIDFDTLFARFVDPEIGYVSSLEEIFALETYVGVNARLVDESANIVTGFGMAEAYHDAASRAIFETLERACGESPKRRRTTVRDSYQNLQGIARHPIEFGLRDNAIREFSNDEIYSWVWAYSFLREKPALVPEQLAYYNTLHGAEPRFVSASSNGCAVGSSLEEAILYGILEVVERDGFFNAWYAKLPLPEIALSHTMLWADGVDRLVRSIRGQGYSVRFFDMSLDIGIPSVMAVAVNEDNKAPKTVCGTAAHIHPEQAAYRALRELAAHLVHCQSLLMDNRIEVEAKFHNFNLINKVSDHGLVASLPEFYDKWAFLLDENRCVEKVSLADMKRHSFRLETNDIKPIVESVISRVQAEGYEVLVINQTSPELAFAELHAAKVLIPGLLPLTVGHGSGQFGGLSRVYDLPVKLGYSSTPLTRKLLNPDPHPFW